MKTYKTAARRAIMTQFSTSLDLNPDSVIRPFMFEPQHSSSSGEEEISVDEETQEDIQRELSTCSRPGNREWCFCGNCQEMTKENERTR